MQVRDSGCESQKVEVKHSAPFWNVTLVPRPSSHTSISDARFLAPFLLSTFSLYNLFHPHSLVFLHHIMLTRTLTGCETLTVQVLFAYLSTVRVIGACCEFRARPFGSST